MTLSVIRPTVSDLGETPTVTVLVDRCAGCQECVVRCPTGAIDMDVDRWVATADSSLCVGCRQCVRTCPFSAITVTGPLVVDERIPTALEVPLELDGDISETRRGFHSWEEALAEADRCLSCPDPTCVRGCPTHNDIPAFIRALSERDLDEAHRVLRRTSVLPDICSRVCDQALQCEGSCSWALAGGTPVAIGALERFITEQAPVPSVTMPIQDCGLEVAVVGSGPAGIAATWQLVEAGAKVTVFEKASHPGGLLDWGIPDFTLPSTVAQRPWDQLEAAGVDLRCSSPVYPDDVEQLTKRFDAVVLAHGAGVPITPPIPGVDLLGVEDASSFLERVHDALAIGTVLEDLAVSRNAHRENDGAVVLVLGAGNTAMDVARSLRRIGAWPICIDWMDPRFAPVRPDELDEARDEGVEVRFSSTVVALEGTDGRVRTARIAKTRQDRADRRPQVLEEGHETLEIDHVVLAMGYRLDQEMATGLKNVPLRKSVEEYPDARFVASGILANPAPRFARSQPVGRLALGRESARVGAAFARGDRVWVVGDALVGPSTVVEAMAQGKRAALAILERHPSRLGLVETAPHRVVIVVDSVGGRTRSAGALLAADFEAKGARVSLCRLQDAKPDVLAEADLLVIGTWTEGLVVTKVGPSKATSAFLADLPPLEGVRIAVFCTYDVAPRKTIEIMTKALEQHGATVIADATVGRRHFAEQVGRFSKALQGELWPKDDGESK